MTRLLTLQRLARCGEWCRRSPGELAVPAATVAGGVACVAVVVYWGLQIAATPEMTPGAEKVAAAPARAGAGGELFGAGPAQAQGLKVTVGGVIRPLGRDDGAAVLSIAGAAPRLVHAGREAAPGLVLSEVRARSVVLKRGGVAQEVAMAPRRVLPVLAAATSGDVPPGPALVSNIPRAGR
ncbi:MULTISPECIES: hypothetical protein [Cupriavidus]